jgi:hypothetical protein
MAWSASGIFVPTFLDQWDATALGIDLTAENHKIALWGSSVTPNFTSDTAYGASPWNSGEASGAGYTSGGQALTGTTLTGASGAVKFDADDTSWASSTITAEGALIYADALVGNNAILAVWFGSAKTTADGTFLITWHANGIAQWDLTP